MSRKRVTLRDIGDPLGLTIQTVSKALRGHAGMSEQTRTEIIKLARQLGYRTREQNRSLRVERIAPYPIKHLRFLLVQNEHSLNFNRLLLEGLRERFSEFGHIVEPLLIPPGLRPDSFEEWAKSQELYYADGLFIAPRMGHDAFEKTLLSLPVPRILLNFPPHESKVDSVIWDVYEAVVQSVFHLKRLGHTRILYAGDIHSQRGFAVRWQAFCEAMASVAPESEFKAWHLDTGNKSHLRASVAAAFERVRPTAVICGVDEWAFETYQAIRALNIAIPGQCSFVPLLNEQTRHLPVCSRPQLLIKESGYRAADRMLWRIANPRLPYEHIRLRGDFFQGRSTGPVQGP